MRAHTWLAFLAVSLTASGKGVAEPATRTFHVDFDNGSDKASGLSPATAWKRAPGDSRAEAVARTTRLQPGDRILFRGGVPYRGTIIARTAGTHEAPIRYEGSSWGTVRAIIDGSNPLPPPRACRSARDCLGSPHWRQLVKLKLPEGARWSDGLYAAGQPHVPARWPAGDAPLTLAPDALPRLLAGHIDLPLPPELAAGEPVLELRVRPGAIGYSPPVQVSPTGLAFAREGWLHWGFVPEPGHNHFALVNVPAMVDRPGLYAMSTSRRVAIAFASPGARDFSIGSGRQGFNLMAGGHVEVRGFDFRNFAGGNPWSRMAAIPLVQRLPLPGVRLAGNRFDGIAATARQPAMLLPSLDGPQLAGNLVEPGLAAAAPQKTACAVEVC